MNEVFRQHVEQLHGKFEALVQMKPARLGALPPGVPQSGLYLFPKARGTCTSGARARFGNVFPFMLAGRKGHRSRSSSPGRCAGARRRRTRPKGRERI